MDARLRSAPAIVVALLAYACGSEAPGPSTTASPPVFVDSVVVEMRSFKPKLSLAGQLEAQEAIQVRSEIAGIVDFVGFTEGQELEQGDLLFGLRDAEQQALLRAAEAARARALDVYQRTRLLAQKNVAASAEREGARAELAVADARLELARVQLEQTKIYAPFKGVAGARLVSAGARVSSDQPLAELNAVLRLVLRFSVAETQIAQVRSDAGVRFSVATHGDETFSGQVYFISPTIDPATRRLTVKALVDNEDRRLRPGMFAQIELGADAEAMGLAVPEAALAYDASGPFVWRVGADSKAERVVLELGAREDGWIQIVSGLKSEDRVVTGGTHKVSAGAVIAPSVGAAPEPQAVPSLGARPSKEGG